MNRKKRAIISDLPVDCPRVENTGELRCIQRCALKGINAAIIPAPQSLSPEKAGRERGLVAAGDIRAIQTGG